MVESKPGVVIIGCPRSGTSFLATLLERRFAYAAPVEPHFVFYFHAINTRFPPDSRASRRRRLDAFMLFLQSWVPVNNKVRDPGTALAYSLLTVLEDLDDIARIADGVPALVGGLFSAFARRQGARGWVEQSVYAQPRKLSHLADYPRGTRVIHLIRDGRDTWMSWSKTWFTPANLEQGASFWREHVRVGRAWGQCHPDRYLELRCEDLIENKAAWLERIGQFLGADQVGPCIAQLAMAMPTFWSSLSPYWRIGLAPSFMSNHWALSLLLDQVKLSRRRARCTGVGDTLSESVTLRLCAA